MMVHSFFIRFRFAAVAAAALMVTAAALAFPKPAPVPYRWELNFDAGPLRMYADPESGQHFWYFTYIVTNRTGRDQLWAPNLTLFTDAGEILPAGKDVPSYVVEDLLELLGNQFLEGQNEIIGDLLQGRENAREGLVIWPARNIGVNEMSLFVSGISGETARVKNPITQSDIVLRKSLQRDYLIRGDATARGSEPIEVVSEQWILR